MMLIKRKMTHYDLRNFSNKIDGNGKSLVVFSEFKYDHILKDCDVMPVNEYETEMYLEYFKDYADGTYDSVICSGLLEHMKEPCKLVEQVHRVLKPGGKAYFSASAVFSVHRGPENYFHFTPFGAKLLFKKFQWDHLDVRGSSGPFRTLGINCQRILLQSEIFFLFRPFLELLAWTLPLLDVFVIRQFDGRKFTDDHIIDTMMPSNIQVIATR